jgi:hypothetical protein
MPILKPNVYLKEKRFVNTGAGKDTLGVRAGANVYEVGDGDTDNIIRIKQAEQEALLKRQSALMSQAFCQRLCCAAILGGAVAAGGAGR